LTKYCFTQTEKCHKSNNFAFASHGVALAYWSCLGLIAYFKEV